MKLEIRNPKSETPRWRRGFTLVELMVVIIIMAILGGLISAAAVGAISRAKEASAKAEIDSLSMAVETYKAKYGSYPPNLQDVDAVRQHILRIFPRCKDPMPTPYGTAAQVSLYVITPNALATTTLSQVIGPVALSGYVWERTASAHALYFWLSGYYPDPEHPLSAPVDSSITTSIVHVSDAPRVSLFDFKQSRLRRTGVFYRPDPFTTVGGSTANLDLTRMTPLYGYYPDRLDAPYVYFDARGYNPADSNPLTNAYSYPMRDNSGPLVLTSGKLTPVTVRYLRHRTTPPGLSDDLSLLSFPVPTGSASGDNTTTVAFPYRSPPTDPNALPNFNVGTTTPINQQYYVNPKSFQIICSGEDGMYSSISCADPMPSEMTVSVGPGGVAADNMVHNDIYLIEQKNSGIWWYPTGQAPVIGAAGTTPRGTDEHRDNLTNFAKKRLDLEIP